MFQNTAGYSSVLPPLLVLPHAKAGTSPLFPLSWTLAISLSPLQWALGVEGGQGALSY